MISVEQARNYVYTHGTLWERALWSYLFDNSSLDRVHQCLLCYKNPDGGWGHGLEHDIKCPDSNPLQLEYLLFLLRDTDLPPGKLLDGSAVWLENNLNPDGSLKNPDTLFNYPLAPWWQEGGQNMPDSITGNLIRWGACTPKIAASTQRWALQNLTLAKIHSNEWLFMAYHAYDYFMNVVDFPNLEAHKQATCENIAHLAHTLEATGKSHQFASLFAFARTPQAEVVQTLPEGLIGRFLDHLENSQREDGGWDDEHNLAHWQPYTTIVNVVTLRNYGRV